MVTGRVLILLYSQGIKLEFKILSMPIVIKDLTNKERDSQTSSLEQFQEDVKQGLTQERKTLPQKYLYDRRGSEIFRKIMSVEEYYPTNCEIELLERNKEAILSMMEEEFNLVDLGAGDAKKTLILLRECQQLKK